MQEVTILQGSYRNEPIIDVRCKLISPLKYGAKGWFGNFDIPDKGTIRVRLADENQITYHSDFVSQLPILSVVEDTGETDEEIIVRIEDRFSILHEITAGAAVGDIRSLIVSGAPGIGKSAGITRCSTRTARASGNITTRRICRGALEQA